MLWSTSGAGIKSAALTGWQVAGGRALFAVIAMAVMLPEARRGFSWRVLAVGGAYAATTVLYAYANTLTTAANAIFLQDTAPFWVLLLSPWLLRELPTRAELAVAPVFLAGTALFFLDRLEAGGALGNALALLSGVAFALLIMGLRGLGGGAEAKAAVLAGNAIAVVVCAPGALAAPIAGGWQDLGIIAYLGVFQLALAYTLFVRGVGRVSALEASLLALIEPILNPIWAFLIAGERPGPWAMVGGATILAATLLRLATARDRGLPAPPPAAPAAPALSLSAREAP